MLSLSVQVEKDRLPQIGSTAHRLLGEVIRQTAFDVEGEAKSLVQDPGKSGRIYRRGDIEHQASAPGEPPATDLGHLVNSIQADTGDAARALRSEVAVGAEYAPVLELGGVRIEPRPFLTPALESQRKRFEAATAAAIRKAAA